MGKSSKDKRDVVSLFVTFLPIMKKSIPRIKNSPLFLLYEQKPHSTIVLLKKKGGEQEVHSSCYN